MSKDGLRGIRRTRADSSEAWTMRFVAPLRVLHRLRAVIALAAGATVAFSGTAFAERGYLSIHPMSLAPASSGTVSGSGYFQNGISLRLLGAGCFSTGLNLPQGAIVRRVELYYRSSTDFDPSFYLYRTKPGIDTHDLLIGVTGMEDSGLPKSMVVPVARNLAVVKNDIYLYGFAVCMGKQDVFDGARIIYTFDPLGS
jgi:hypothetical protein